MNWIFQGMQKNNKGSYWYISQKVKVKENNKTENVTTNMEEAKELNHFFHLFSMVISLPACFKTLNLKAAAGTMKSLLF